MQREIISIIAAALSSLSSHRNEKPTQRAEASHNAKWLLHPEDLSIQLDNFEAERFPAMVVSYSCRTECLKEKQQQPGIETSNEDAS